MKTILVVDDELGIRESFRMILKDYYRVLAASDGLTALEIIRNENVHLVILDIIMPGMDGLEVLKEMRKIRSDIVIIVVTAVKTIKTAIEAMKSGASDYIIKPFDVEEIKIVISKTLKFGELIHEVAYLRSEINKDFAFDNIVGRCPAMKRIFDTVAKVAKGNTPVLVSGESGTGKELIARAIHLQSLRKDKPFVAISCPNLPETLLESELFGHEKGAFTNAVEKKIGRFEMADGGTLFLDEISELSLSNQTKLLRVLQEYEFVRVGGNKTITADVRLIASTNMSLKEAINRGTFRKDLFYRINVVPIELPALRNRRDDIPLLLSYYFQKYKKELRSKAKKFDQNAMQSLEEYGWPGNIRELKNVVERTLTLYGDHDSILNEHLPVEIRSGSDKGPLCNSEVIIKHLQEESLEEIISRMERELIEKALRETNGVQMKAARLLKTTRRILRYKMDKLGMTVVLPFLFMCLFS